MPENPQVTNVSDLLLPSGGWNEDLIKQVFFNVDAQAILCTPTRGHGNDAWAWEPERHGLYTIGSAYRKLYEDNNQPVNDGGASVRSVPHAPSLLLSRARVQIVRRWRTA